MFAASLAMLVTVTAGCAGSPEASAPTPTMSKAPAATRTATPRPTPTPAKRTDAELGYLLNVKHDPFLDDLSDKELLQLGHRVCTDLAGGADLGKAKKHIRKTVNDQDSANLLAWTAVEQFCDEHDQLVEVDQGGPEHPQADPTGDAKTQFVAAVRELDGVDDTVTDDMIVMLGTTMCDGFTRGDSLKTSLGYMDLFTHDTAVAFLKATTKYICPEHADKVK